MLFDCLGRGDQSQYSREGSIVRSPHLPAGLEQIKNSTSSTPIPKLAFNPFYHVLICCIVLLLGKKDITLAAQGWSDKCPMIVSLLKLVSSQHQVQTSINRIFILSSSFSQHLCEVGSITPILQIMKLRLSEVKQFVQDHKKIFQIRCSFCYLTLLLFYSVLKTFKYFN